MLREVGRAGRPVWVAVVVATWLCGCGTSSAARREDVDALKRDLREQRERQAALERRLSDMDARLALMADRLSRGVPGTATRPNEGGPVALHRPSLGVVKVGPRPGRAPPAESPPPEGPAVVTDADAPPPEPDDDGDDLKVGVDHQVLAASRGPAAAAPGGALAAREEEVVARTDPKTQYDLAMRHYKAHRYAEAARGFEDVADRWADHPLADNSIYWTGVCYLAQGEMALAVNELQKVPVRYPKSDKVPDALFQLAEAYQRLGDKESARAMLTQVVEMYPQAEAARPAREGLARLSQP